MRFWPYRNKEKQHEKKKSKKLYFFTKTCLAFACMICKCALPSMKTGWCLKPIWQQIRWKYLNISLNISKLQAFVTSFTSLQESEFVCPYYSVHKMGIKLITNEIVSPFTKADFFLLNLNFLILNHYQILN